MKESRAGLAAVIVLASLSALTSSLAPAAVGRAVNAIASGEPAAAPLAALLALYIGDAAMRFAQHWLMASTSQRIVLRIRTALFASLKKMPLAFFDAQAHGDLMSRLTNDTDSISMTISGTTAMLLTQLVSLAGAFSLMLWISPPLTLIALLGGAGMIALVRAVTSRTRALFIRQQKLLGALNGHVEESISGLAAVRAFGREKKAIERFERVNEELRGAAERAQSWSGCLMPAANVAGNVSYLVIAAAGGLLILRGALDIGGVTGFLLSIRTFMRPFQGLANAYNDLQSAVAGLERIYEIEDAPSEPDDRPGAAACQHLCGDVELKNVTFGYAPGHPVLKNVSLRVKPGTRTALVGPTGAGKTTLAALLPRFYDVDEGAVLIDGRDVRDYQKRSLRACFSVVPQDTALFSATVRDNIAYGRPGAALEEVEAAARAAKAADFIERLPHGYDTYLHGGGADLSQGQRQLIAIARALLRASPIVILDEATSAVDTLTERRIHSAMRELMKGRTAFIIAHRLSTIRDCDLIAVVADGRIAEQGTHDELLARGGAYAQMYRAQSCEELSAAAA